MGATTPRAPTRAMWAAWGVGTIVLGLLYVAVLPSPDQAIFQYLGWIASMGGRYYVDGAEQNWPGIMFFHELSVRLLGNHTWTYHTLDYIVMLIGAWALTRLTNAASGGRTGWYTLPVYQVMYVSSGAWFAGQRDIVAANLLLIAAWLLARRVRGPVTTRWWPVACGAIIGLVVLIRPTYLLVAPVFLAIDFVTRHATGRSIRVRLVDAGCAVLGIGLVIGGVAVAGAIVGNLDDWYEQGILFNLQAYGGLSQSRLVTAQRLLGFSAGAWGWYLLCSVAMLVWWAKNRAARLEQLMIVGVAVVGILSSIVQNKGFGYHLGAVVPLLAATNTTVIAAGYDWWRQRPTPRRAAIAGTVAVWTALCVAKDAAHLRWQALYYIKGCDPTVTDERAELHRIVTFVREQTEPEDHVLVWGRGVLVNFLAERQSPVRFITTGMLELATDRFVSGDAWQAELAAALRDKRPRLVLTEIPVSTDPLPKKYKGRATPVIVELLLRDYERVATFDTLVAYQPREPLP